VPFRGPSSSKYGGEWYDESDRPDLLGVMDGLPLTMVTCCNIKHTIGLANVDILDNNNNGRCGSMPNVSRDGAKQPIALLGVYPIRIPDPRGDCGGSGCPASKGYKNVYIPPSR
jgi:hypothetical protein